MHTRGPEGERGRWCVCVCVSLEMIPLWWAWGHWDLDALAVMLAVCAWLWRVVGSCGSLPRGGYKDVAYARSLYTDPGPTRDGRALAHPTPDATTRRDERYACRTSPSQHVGNTRSERLTCCPVPISDAST